MEKEMLEVRTQPGFNWQVLVIIASGRKGESQQQGDFCLSTLVGTSLFHLAILLILLQCHCCTGLSQGSIYYFILLIQT